MNRLRVALVGCGQIADAHLGEIGKIPAAELVAVCDSYLDLAQQAAARFGVPRTFDDIDQLLASGAADVLHITTPVHTHCSLAVKALRAGLHVYVEKPFTLDLAEADVVMQAAEQAGRLVCVGHNQLFDPAWQACRALVRSGQLGQVVRVESFQGYDLQGPFGKLVLSNPQHWVHKMPGGLIQNVIPHAVYRVLDFLPDEKPQVTANVVQDLCGDPPRCEMTATLGGAQVTAAVIFSSCMRPLQQFTRVYGTRQSIEIDLEAQLLRAAKCASTRGPFAKIEVPFRQLVESCRNTAASVWRFLRSDLHYFAGMRTLFGEFYQAIRGDAPLPISYAEIRRVTAVIDALFAAPSAGHRPEGQAQSKALSTI